MRKWSMEELNRKTVDDFHKAEKTEIVVVLDNIRSMHNVGSVFRTADAFLLEGIYLCGYTPKPPHRDIQKTALGATETVAWKYFPTTKDAIEELKNDGYSIYSVEQAEGSLPLQAASSLNQPKIAIVFGNEVEGVAQEILAYSDGCIEIPQFGMKHSLNISVAAGIVLWELVRNRIGAQ
jgi:tRNA G18 (ribose-2'-O)-methylase SpoU